MNVRLSLKNIAMIVLVIFCIVVFLMMPIPIPAEVSVIDFRPYWSSSFLLAHRQDFGDLSQLDAIERSLTGWREPYTMYAWFAPTGNLILLPYTLFSFPRAAYYWFITNIIVVFSSAVLLWHNIKVRPWVPVVIIFCLYSTLDSLYVGQVNTLVLLGLALFLFFIEKQYEFAAGASLVLTTIKPHLVIIALPLSILNIIWRKQWSALAGFISTLILCFLLLFILYPSWPISFWQVVTSGMSGFRESPTIPGLLVHAGQGYGRWLWIPGLFLAILFWWRRKNGIDQRILIDLSILLGIIVSPIGWSYDQIVLIIPLLHLVEWMMSNLLAHKTTITIAWILLVANLLSFYEHTFSISDVWFFWIPFIVIFVYVIAWKQMQARINDAPSKTG
jgi:hypothetical protein